MIKHFGKLMMVVVAAASIFSCKPEIDSVNGADVIALPGVQNRIVLIPYDVTDTVVTVNTTGWCNATISYASTQEEWVTMEPADGAGRGTYSLSFSFTTNQELADRIATVTIQSETDPTLFTSFDLKQVGKAPFITTSVPAIGVSKLGGPYTFTVSTNKSCDISVVYPSSYVGEDWLTPDPIHIEPGLDIVITLEALENETGDRRTASVKIADSADPTASYNATVSVSQGYVFVETAFVTTYNGDSLYCTWLGDDACKSYTVEVSDPADPETVYLTVTGISPLVNAISLLNYPEIADLVAPMSVNVIGVTDVPGITAPAIEPWVTHSRFATGSGDGLSVATSMLISAPRHINNITLTEDARGWYYKQSADIDYTNYLSPSKGNKNFVPIATDTDPFTGVYDGQGYTISNWAYSTIVNSQGSSGLFASIKGTASEVKNLVVDNANLTISAEDSYVAHATTPDVGHSIVVGYNEGGTVSNVNITNSLITCVPRIYLGSVVGVNHGGTVSHCTITDCTINQPSGGNKTNNNGPYIGGIVGLSWPSSTVEYCRANTSSITNNAQAQADAPGMTGGIVGGSDGLVFQCYNDHTNMSLGTGTNSFGGGIVGGSIAPKGKIQWTGSRYPDVANYETATGIIRQCGNVGDITKAGTCYMGGIVGEMGSNNLTDYPTDELIIEQCWNNGSVGTTAANGAVYIGGIVGRPYWLTIQNCYYGTSVTDSEGDFHVGALLATNRQDGVAGGIAGYLQRPNKVINCYVAAGVLAIPSIKTTFVSAYDAGVSYGHYANDIIGGVFTVTGSSPTDANLSTTVMSGCFSSSSSGSPVEGYTMVGTYSLWQNKGKLYVIGGVGTPEPSQITVTGCARYELYTPMNGATIYTAAGWSTAVWAFGARRPQLIGVPEIAR